MMDENGGRAGRRLALRLAARAESRGRLIPGHDQTKASSSIPWIIARHPVVHIWSYKLDNAAWCDSNLRNAELVPTITEGRGAPPNAEGRHSPARHDKFTLAVPPRAV